uniref:Uncharacterized protein n=1 Tax=Setaria viridis TaxID=4556 RepID=A0A4U6TSK9_SETVI|nr:hypothetical protein SEVIR_7G060250v2 [Setaria viridis]
MFTFTGVLLTILLRCMHSLNLLADFVNIWHSDAVI